MQPEGFLAGKAIGRWVGTFTYSIVLHLSLLAMLIHLYSDFRRRERCSPYQRRALTTITTATTAKYEGVALNQFPRAWTAGGGSPATLKTKRRTKEVSIQRRRREECC